jgi:hypothetical protein
MREVSIVGLDLTKRVFQVHAAGSDGGVVLRRKLSRGPVIPFFTELPKCTVAMEACATAHHWVHEIGKPQHNGKLSHRFRRNGGLSRGNPFRPKTLFQPGQDRRRRPSAERHRATLSHPPCGLSAGPPRRHISGPAGSASSRASRAWSGSIIQRFQSDAGGSGHGKCVRFVATRQGPAGQGGDERWVGNGGGDGRIHDRHLQQTCGLSPQNGLIRTACLSRIVIDNVELSCLVLCGQKTRGSCRAICECGTESRREPSPTALILVIFFYANGINLSPDS